jgi:hypothetical protein
MDTRLPETEDTQLNMTPMIDVVFQLVTFFLLTLRFTAPEERIDASLPRHVGISRSPEFHDRVSLKVKLFRVNPTDPERAFTRVRVGNTWTLDVPSRGDGVESAWRSVSEEIRSQHGRIAGGGPGGGAPVHGAIAVPPPHGGLVPHGDVVRVLDAFLLAHLEDVSFEGTHAPETWR